MLKRKTATGDNPVIQYLSYAVRHMPENAKVLERAGIRHDRPPMEISVSCAYCVKVSEISQTPL